MSDVATCFMVVDKDAEGDYWSKPGAMFYVTFSGRRCNTHEPACERHLMCVLPNGHAWEVDGRASNCTMREDKVHRCWVRHGEPPVLTVDKNGVTCAAGAGSIQSGPNFEGKSWHGFLRNGVLSP